MSDLSRGREEYLVTREPYYRSVGGEVALFEAAWRQRLPVMLKGPTGCGKSRFVEYMAWKLGRPLVTVACNEDVTASDLVGRFLLDGQGTRWQDGPLTQAARMGAICYLDEIVEARQDTMVVIHPLTDHRRVLPLDKKGELVRAHPDFQLVISYNPGYQSLMKDLKQSTKQRFTALDFDYPARDAETDIVASESGLDPATCARLVDVAHRARALKGHGLDEGVSTRLVVYAAKLVTEGVLFADACAMAMTRPVTDDADVRATLIHAAEVAQ
ncbi:MAG: CbbQ/NirQ/NorQ/GpvN family protein [Magnetospirillum sp.]|nr:CbbQ/NirQ/NorQ/GpvN family protein [Magnetospirillum sp.]